MMDNAMFIASAVQKIIEKYGAALQDDMDLLEEARDTALEIADLMAEMQQDPRPIE